MVGSRVAAMMSTGEPLMIAIGAGISMILVAILYGMFREWLLALTVSKMSEQLHDEGKLVHDDLPRSPGGRIDRQAADEQFSDLRQQVEQQPDDWGAWFNLAFGYEASGDRRRARSALRTAAQLYRTQNKASR